MAHGSIVFSGLNLAEPGKVLWAWGWLFLGLQTKFGPEQNSLHQNIVIC